MESVENNLLPGLETVCVVKSSDIWECDYDDESIPVEDHDKNLAKLRETNIAVCEIDLRDEELTPAGVTFPLTRVTANKRE